MNLSFYICRNNRLHASKIIVVIIITISFHYSFCPKRNITKWNTERDETKRSIYYCLKQESLFRLYFNSCDRYIYIYTQYRIVILSIIIKAIMTYWMLYMVFLKIIYKININKYYLSIFLFSCLFGSTKNLLTYINVVDILNIFFF